MSTGGGTVIIHHSSQVQVDAVCNDNVTWEKKMAAIAAVMCTHNSETVQTLFEAIFDAIQACP